MSLAPSSGQRVPVRTVVGGGRDTHDGHENSPILVFFSNLLKSRATDARDEDHRRLQATIGELLMETELLYAKVDQLEASGPLARRRSTR